MVSISSNYRHEMTVVFFHLHTFVIKTRSSIAEIFIFNNARAVKDGMSRRLDLNLVVGNTGVNLTMGCVDPLPGGWQRWREFPKETDHVDS